MTIAYYESLSKSRPEYGARGAEIGLPGGANLEGVDLKSLDLRGVRVDITQAAAVARAHGAIVG